LIAAASEEKITLAHEHSTSVLGRVHKLIKKKLMKKKKTRIGDKGESRLVGRRKKNGGGKMRKI